MLEITTLIFHALILGFFGYLFVYKLIQDGELLGIYGRLIHFIENHPIKESLSSCKPNLLNRLLNYISKPLGGCIVCFTGQFSLWVSVLYLESSFKDVFLIVVLSMFIAFILERKIY